MAQKTNSGKTRQEKIEAITAKLEKGIHDFFEGGQFQTYLKTLSKFHQYSLNNQIMIAMQRPDASYVAGFRAWEEKFARHVKKGEKGIQILAPIVRNEKDEVTGEIKNTWIAGFRPTWVFDISQTVGAPLPQICKRLDTNVLDFNEKKQILCAISPVPVTFEMFSGEAYGYYLKKENRIVVKSELPEAQTLKTLVHEIAHAHMHKDTEKPRDVKEVEAEAVAYTVCSYYGLDTSDYSFGYVAAWSCGKELEELRGSMQDIHTGASDLIHAIEKEMVRVKSMEKEKLPVVGQPAAGRIKYIIQPITGEKPTQLQTREQIKESVKGPNLAIAPGGEHTGHVAPKWKNVKQKEKQWEEEIEV